MNTTALFVELIVIGVGAIIWLSLSIISLFDYDWVPWKEFTSIIALTPFLAITYVLGIVTDRLSDQIFSEWDKEIRKEKFLSSEEYHRARTYTYTYAADRIINLFEYGRSRLRIIRAWSVNSLFLAISIPIFVWSRFPTTSSSTRILITFLSITFFGLGSFATFYTWKKLARNDYNRLAETYDFLRQEKSHNSGNQGDSNIKQAAK